jgi:hypothetical protein
VLHLADGLAEIVLDIHACLRVTDFQRQPHHLAPRQPSPQPPDPHRTHQRCARRPEPRRSPRGKSAARAVVLAHVRLGADPLNANSRISRRIFRVSAVAVRRRSIASVDRRPWHGLVWL